MPSAAHAALYAAGHITNPTISPPVVTFAATMNNLTASVDCSGSYGTSSPIILSSWDFGDSSAVQTGVTQTHTYAAAGTYTITYTATQQDGATASTTRTVTATAPSSGTQPSGPNIVAIQSLSGATFGEKVRTAGGKQVSLQPATTYTVTPFIDSGSGATLSSFGGLRGSGIDSSTIITAAPLSSTQTDSTGSTPTPYRALRTNGDDLVLDNFTLRGTPQQHIYHGMTVTGNNATVSNIKIASTPGNDLSPHGETFMLEAYACTGTYTMNAVEIDGGDVAASGFGINGNSTKQASFAITDLYVHGVTTCKGAAFWQSYSGGTITRYKSRDNGISYGFEECAGTWTLDTCEFGGTVYPADIHLGSSHSDKIAKITIINPQYLNGQTKVRVWIPSSYGGNGGGQGNAQSASDITIYSRDGSGNLTDVTSSQLQIVPYPFPNAPIANIFAYRNGTTLYLDGGTSYHYSNVASSALTYAWEFGDGSTASGQTVQKTFSSANATSVKLTVTLSGVSKSKTINA